MRRHIPGLRQTIGNRDEFIEGIFLVRVDRVYYRWHLQRPFYLIRFAIVEPESKRGQSFSGRIYCTQRAMWKLDWFLRDFRYDTDLIGREEIDEKALIGLTGIIHVSRTILNGHNYLNLSGFAPADDWNEQSAPHSDGEEART